MPFAYIRVGRTRNREKHMRHGRTANTLGHVALWLAVAAAAGAASAPDALGVDLPRRIEAHMATLRDDPTRLDARLALGRLYLTIEAFDPAAEQYEAVLAAGPGEAAAAHHGLGLTHAGGERFDDAIRQYDLSISYDADRAFVHAARGSAYAHLHRYDEAIEAYRSALSLEPGDAMVRHQLGLALARNGRIDDALAEQEAAIASMPDLASARLELGSLHSGASRWEEARREYRAALALDADLTQALYGLAQIAMRTGDADGARVLMEQFAVAQERSEEVGRLIGAAQRASDRTERAGILASLGRLRLQQGAYDKARQTYAKACALDPTLAGAHGGLGVALTMLEAYDDAETAQRAALRIDPDMARAHAGLGLSALGFRRRR